MSDLVYKINKGVNRPVEFRGLKGPYIYVLAIGLAILLVSFAILYIAGVSVYLLVPGVVIAGSGLMMGVHRLSHRYGQHGLMKALATGRVPSAIVLFTRQTFIALNARDRLDSS